MSLQSSTRGRRLRAVNEMEPFDWSPEINLVKGLLLPSRVR
jgi:hypothetical protein